MKYLRSVAFLLLLTIGAMAQQNKSPRVVAYFSGRIEELDSIDVSKLSHLIYCFGHLDSLSRFHLRAEHDTAMIRKMVTLKGKNPQLKVLLSIGGWGGCENCSDGFSTTQKRKVFAASVSALSDFFGTDGIDLDWEYPTIRLDNDIDQNPVHKNTPEDKANFTDLVRQLRSTLGNQSTISFAAGGFNTYLKGAVEWREVIKAVDFINLMSYDLINGYSTTTGHHTALYSTPKQVESTDNAVKYLLSIGVPAGQIVIGAAFYARVWENVPPAGHGLCQQGKFKEGFAYKLFDTRLAGYQRYWDDVAKAPYAYSQSEKKFATYDNERSVALKTRYVLDHHLGGIMFWEIANDTFHGGLVDTIANTLKAAK